MCGIAGIVSLADGPSVDGAVLTRMRDSMAHRGPNGGKNWISDNGRVGFAHRRLSVIDLSDAASQPMSNDDKNVVITFNGEIYNHARLREDLQRQGFRFNTDHSDTEVLVHGYSAWGGRGLLDRLEGDFAFAIWDAGRGMVFLARDRIGVKPLYFSFQKSVFLFGSEIKAILEHPTVTPDIDPMAMNHYLSFMTTPCPMTMFAGIFKLPPGFSLELSLDGKVKAERYWEALPGQAGVAAEIKGLSWAAREDFYVTEIRRRLDASVEKRMMSDVPFGVFLSGGVDSSTNVALMKKYTSSPLETFSVGFKDHTELNELDYAQRIADKFGTNHHEILIDEADMVGYLGDLIHSQDEPIADWVCVPLYFVTKLTKDNDVTVVQVGEGADEQFCGYASYMGYLELYKKYWSPFREYLPSSAQSVIAKMAGWAASVKPGFSVYADIIDRAARDREHFWTGATAYWDVFKDQLVASGSIQALEIPEAVKSTGMLPGTLLNGDSFEVIRAFRDRFLSRFPDSDILARMTYTEFQLRLPELLLMRVDKITMSESIEARVPFLDHALVEFTMDIPMEDKIHNGVAKYLLKKAVEGIIPDENIYRKKMGFGAPMGHWLRGDFGIQAEREIMASELLERGYFNVDFIRMMFAEHRAGRSDYSLLIWVLYNLFAWYDYWITGKDRRDVAA